MRIFQLTTGGESEWIYAKTAIQALKEYVSITGNNLDDFEDDDEITEVPKEKWGELKISFPDNPESEVLTFEEYVKEIDAPCIMCSTVY